MRRQARIKAWFIHLCAGMGGENIPRAELFMPHAGAYMRRAELFS
jgi:hypothetical protein